MVIQKMDSKGFTLLEMLLAATIFAIVMTAAWTAFGNLIGNSRDNQETIDQDQAVSNFYLQIYKDLKTVVGSSFPKKGSPQSPPKAKPAIRLTNSTPNSCSSRLELETVAYLFPDQSHQDRALTVQYRIQAEGPVDKSIRRAVSPSGATKSKHRHLDPIILPRIGCWNLLIQDYDGKRHHVWPPAGASTASSPKPQWLKIRIHPSTERSQPPIHMAIFLGL